MKDYLKHYKIKLKTEGAVFVGSGKEFSKKEYLFSDGWKKIGILDFNRFYSFLCGKDLSNKFETFFINENKSDLRHWMADNNISYEDIKPYLKYEIECGNTSLEKGKKAQIMEFVKDVYGCPYIPGSSVKGMLRTVLETMFIHDDIGLYKNDKFKISDRLDNTYKANRGILKYEEKDISVKTFNKLDRNNKKVEDAVNDILSGLIVGDSLPLSVNDLVLCQKIEIHCNGKETSLNLLRECIKPGVEIEIPLSIDSSICSLDIDEIYNAVNVYDSIYESCFVNAFGNSESVGNKTVFVGGGVGFASKTLVYPLYGKKDGIEVTKKIFEKTGVPQNHKHNKDKELGVSPHILKCTKWNGKLYQMGKCKIDIK